MHPYSYWFFWAMCFFSCVGVGTTFSNIGNFRKPYTKADGYAILLVTILNIVACFLMEGSNSEGK